MFAQGIAALPVLRWTRVGPGVHRNIAMRAQVLEEMQAQGHRPDVGVYNVVIEALSRSGVLLLQLKAAQLFQAAVRQGQLRCAAPAAPVSAGEPFIEGLHCVPFPPDCRVPRPLRNRHY